MAKLQTAQDQDRKASASRIQQPEAQLAEFKAATLRDAAAEHAAELDAQNMDAADVALDNQDNLDTGSSAPAAVADDHLQLSEACEQPVMPGGTDVDYAAIMRGAIMPWFKEGREEMVRLDIASPLARANSQRLAEIHHSHPEILFGYALRPLLHDCHYA